MPAVAKRQIIPTRSSIASAIPRGYGIFRETKLLDTVVDTVGLPRLGHERAYIIQNNLFYLKRAQ